MSRQTRCTEFILVETRQTNQATALASITVGQHPLLRRALPDRSLTLLFIGLPDHPKRNQEGLAQLHGIVTTLGRSAVGTRVGTLSTRQGPKGELSAGMLRPCLTNDHGIFSRARMDFLEGARLTKQSGYVLGYRVRGVAILNR